MCQTYGTQKIFTKVISTKYKAKLQYELNLFLRLQKKDKTNVLIYEREALQE